VAAAGGSRTGCLDASSSLTIHCALLIETG
jgi:hypothetical protein